MKSLLILVFSVFIFATQANARNMIRVKAIGSSPKGQFVAFEEFGYMNGSKTAFARIKVKNVWKDKYVYKKINVTADENNQKLDQVRAKAIELAKKELLKFNIRS